MRKKEKNNRRIAASNKTEIFFFKLQRHLYE